MAHGVPVAAFDLGGVREYLVDTKNGFTVPEHGDMNKVLRHVYQNHEVLLPEMSRYAVELVKEKFSEEKFITAFNKLCEVLK
jgi:glycosyltransferase involved in cell wall biosynthesis